MLCAAALGRERAPETSRYAGCQDCIILFYVTICRKSYSLHTRIFVAGGEYKGVVDVIMRIIAEEGYQKLWAGVSSSLLLCCNPAIQFAVYETVKKAIIARKGKGQKKALSSLEAFVLGAVAKLIATVTTYPLQVSASKIDTRVCARVHTQMHTHPHTPTHTRIHTWCRNMQYVYAMLPGGLLLLPHTHTRCVGPSGPVPV